jgi:hypothetical protein
VLTEQTTPAALVLASSWASAAAPNQGGAATTAPVTQKGIQELADCQHRRTRSRAERRQGRREARCFIERH